MRALVAALLLFLVTVPSDAKGVSLAGVNAQLIAKANEIVSVCGSVVLSSAGAALSQVCEGVN